MFGDWFNTKEVDAVADEIVADLAKRLPPTPGPHTRKTADRLRKTHDVIFARLEQFARSRKLNIYKKARLGNRVRWALRCTDRSPASARTGTPIHKASNVVVPPPYGRESNARSTASNWRT